MSGPNWVTSNKEAQVLIKQALEKCIGCRQSWRLFDHGQGWQHGVPAGRVFCQASEERQQLRDIAAKVRGK